MLKYSFLPFLNPSGSHSFCHSNGLTLHPRLLAEVPVPAFQIFHSYLPNLPCFSSFLHFCLAFFHFYSSRPLLCLFPVISFTVFHWTFPLQVNTIFATFSSLPNFLLFKRPFPSPVLSFLQLVWLLLSSILSYTVNLKTMLFSISLNYSIKLKYYITLANIFSSESRLCFLLIRWHSFFPYNSR